MTKKAILFLFGCLFFIGTSAQELTVGSYNIRNKNKNDSINGNVWQVRSKAIAHQMGGKIGVISQGEGKGSTFWFWTPLNV